MQVIRCSECRQVVFFYDGDIMSQEGIKPRKATYPDGTQPGKYESIRRICRHGRIFKTQDKSIYVDGETETPYAAAPSEDWLESGPSPDHST